MPDRRKNVPDISEKTPIELPNEFEKTADALRIALEGVGYMAKENGNTVLQAMIHDVLSSMNTPTNPRKGTIALQSKVNDLIDTWSQLGNLSQSDLELRNRIKSLADLLVLLGAFEEKANALQIALEGARHMAEKDTEDNGNIAIRDTVYDVQSSIASITRTTDHPRESAIAIQHKVDYLLSVLRGLSGSEAITSCIQSTTDLLVKEFNPPIQINERTIAEAIEGDGGAASW